MSNHIREPKSICNTCAIDISLKKFVSTNTTGKHLCGICGRKDRTASDPIHRDALSSLMRSLVRFYFNEWEYNRHVGGEDSPVSLLLEKNPIIGPVSAKNIGSDYTYNFLHDLLFYPDAYPGYDKGVSVHAGHHEDMRMLNKAIYTSFPDAIGQIQSALTISNYFDVESLLDKYLAGIGSRLDSRIEMTDSFYRARIGTKGIYFNDNEPGWSPKVNFQPYCGIEIGAPPPANANLGRANRHGVSFLYLATDVETAIAEIRPHPGHRVSIGQFRPKRPLSVVNFDTDISLFATSNKELDLFHIVHSIDRMMGTPVTPDDRGLYSVTQLVADAFRRKGYDGIKFKSSVGAGMNLCFYHPIDFEWVPDSADVFEVTSVKYDVTKSRVIVKPGDDDIPVTSNGTMVYP